MSGQNGFIQILNENELHEGSMKLVRVEGVPVLLIKQLPRFSPSMTTVHIWAVPFQEALLRAS